MKKFFIFILSFILLVSCSKNVDNSSSTIDNSQSSTTALEFDKNLIGTWYVHQSMMGLASINEEIIIKEDETIFLDVSFHYVGLYENFEGTCLFKSPKGTVDFVVGLDDDGNLDWAISDIDGNQDWGYAKSSKHVSGIQYSYEGSTWPINLIKEYLSTNEDIPIFEHGYYYLYTGISQLYNDEKYCMIDIFNVDDTARDDYTLILKEAGYTISTDNSTFYQGYDSNHIYTIRLKQYEDNLSIFIYYYSTFYA